MAEKRKKNIAEPIGQVAAGGGLIGAGKIVGSKKLQHKLGTTAMLINIEEFTAKKIGSKYRLNWPDNTLERQRIIENMGRRFDKQLSSLPVRIGVAQRSGFGTIRKGIGAGGKAITLKTPSRMTLAHEIGHAQQYFKKTKIERLWKHSHRSTENLRAFIGRKQLKIFNKKNNFTHKIFSKNLRVAGLQKVADSARAVNEAVHLVHETDAWRRAHGMFTKASQKRAVRKSAAKSLLTYAVAPVTKLGKAALITAGIAALGFGAAKLKRRLSAPKRAEKQAKKVVYRRIRGRIVPIKVK